jgi:sodium-coupled neutral amino acid transporter 11
MFAQVVPALLQYMWGEHVLISRTAILIYLTLLFLPFAFMKELSSFSIISFLTVLSVLSIAVIIFYESLVSGAFNPPLPDAYAFVHPEALSALGRLSYIFVCHDLSFNVFGSLKRSSKKKYYSIVVICISITVTTVSTLGICGYLLFFDLNLKEANVVQLLPWGDPVAMTARIFLMVAISLSIPYSAFMPRQALCFVMMQFFPKYFSTPQKENILHAIVTILVLLTALTIALTVSDLGVVFELTGGVSACSLAYIIPPLLVLRLEEGRFTANKIAATIVLLVGICIFVSSIGSVIYSIFNP